MTEEQKRQLDTINIVDILAYLSSKTFEMSEALRYTKKRVATAKEIIADAISSLEDLSELSGISYKSKLKEQVEQFLKEK